MYIEPRTNIRILTNVPLDKTYDHTIYFNSAGAQSSYFITLQKYNLTNYTYQRVKRGVARVGIVADNLYDCNYMMFQNTSFGNKWFYAFITSVEYINNECSEIQFEIDVMQTWFFDYNFDMCFVEREHAETDNIGDNIIPENLEVGEYVYNGYGKLTKLLDPLAVIIMISDEDELNDGTVYDGVYGGCTLFAYNIDDVVSIKNKINQYLQKPDAIVGMYMCPTVAMGAVIELGGTKIDYSETAYTINIIGDSVSSELNLDGYKPKNNKLYTYPYNFLNVSTGSTSNVYRYEFFENLIPKFDIDVPITMPIQVALRPKNYKGSKDNTLNSESLVLSNYPMCSWNTDAFKAWLAQNALPIYSAGRHAIGIAGGMLLGTPLSPIAIGATALSISNLMSQGYKASISADITKGSLSSGNIDVASKKQSFWGGRTSVNKNYAKIIDDYFTKYGYAVKSLKRPNRSSRPHWNYVKTLGCTLTGSIPADDIKKLCDIYDNGITFWKNGSEVGNYSLDNSPT